MGKFLRSKDETPEFVTTFLKQIQVGLNKTVRFIRTDNGTEFVNQVMSEYYEGVGIFHQKSVPRTPQQNGVVERRNRTLVEAALFGALCYPTNDSKNLGKFQAKADIGIFVGYAPSRKGYRIYNKRTRRLMETIHVTFDEMHQSMAPARMSSGPEPFIMTPGQLKSGLAPTDKELEMLFQPMFDEHLEQSRVNEPVPSATEINAQVVPPGTSLSTTIAQDAPSTSASSSTSDIHHPVQHQEIAEEPIHEDTPIIHDVLHPSHNLVTGDPGSAQSSSGNVNSAEPNQVNYLDHLEDGPKDHPLGHQNIHCQCCNQEFDLLPDGMSKMLFWKWCLHEEVFVSQPEGIEDQKSYSHLSSEEGSLWAKAGNKGVNTMAEQNVPTQPPTRTDEQIVPRSQWLTIGKSNLLFNAQKIQRNPIFQISVDILSNTNFFQAFTASANVPAIYLQQFWNTMKYNEKTGAYSCQVDEQWFNLSADLLRKALAITPVIPAHPFELPPSGNTVIDFVNELGYPEPVEIVSNIRVNYVYQPWRAILTLINQCLTGKTSGSDKPRHPVLQMLWGIVTQTNVDHAELLWEEFTQGIQTFFSHKASHKASLKNPKKKVTPSSSLMDGNLSLSLKPSSDKNLPSDKLQQKLERGSHFLTVARMMKAQTRIYPQEKGEGEGDDADLERAIKLSLDPAFLPQGRAPVGGVTIRDPVSETTSKLHEMFASADSIKSFLLAVQVTFLLIMVYCGHVLVHVSEIESSDYVSVVMFSFC
ncbi:retrovirus-related pol polyprotein from transposon TNT 1-94 [Tanacetum coccineum]